MKTTSMRVGLGDGEAEKVMIFRGTSTQRDSLFSSIFTFKLESEFKIIFIVHKMVRGLMFFPFAPRQLEPLTFAEKHKYSVLIDRKPMYALLCLPDDKYQ